MDDWHQRLLREHTDLVERHNKLGAFLGTAPFEALAPRDQELLTQQYRVMGEYAVILQARLDRASVRAS